MENLLVIAMFSSTFIALIFLFSAFAVIVAEYSNNKFWWSMEYEHDQKIETGIGKERLVPEGINHLTIFFVAVQNISFGCLFALNGCSWWWLTCVIITIPLTWFLYNWLFKIFGAVIRHSIYYSSRLICHVYKWMARF